MAVDVVIFPSAVQITGPLDVSNDVELERASGTTVAVHLNQNSVIAWHIENRATSGLLAINDGGGDRITVAHTTGAVAVPGPFHAGSYVLNSARWPVTSALVSTLAPSNGAAAALPPNPLGYLLLHLNGTDIGIPYYSL